MATLQLQKAFCVAEYASLMYLLGGGGFASNINREVLDTYTSPPKNSRISCIYIGRWMDLVYERQCILFMIFPLTYYISALYNIVVISFPRSWRNDSRVYDVVTWTARAWRWYNEYFIHHGQTIVICSSRRIDVAVVLAIPRDRVSYHPNFSASPWYVVIIS